MWGPVVSLLVVHCGSFCVASLFVFSVETAGIKAFALSSLACSAYGYRFVPYNILYSRLRLSLKPWSRTLWKSRTFFVFVFPWPKLLFAWLILQHISHKRISRRRKKRKKKKKKRTFDLSVFAIYLLYQFRTFLAKQTWTDPTSQYVRTWYI